MDARPLMAAFKTDINGWISCHALHCSNGIDEEEMENLIYNELRHRGYNVDVGVVTYNGKDAQGKSFRSQLEVDFVCNKGNERIYVQSALALPTQEKIDQETHSLRRIDDGFQKIVITGDHSIKSHDDQGILFTNIYDFLLS